MGYCYFPLHIHLLLNVLVFKVWFPKGEKKEPKEKRGCQPFNSPGSHLSQRRRGLQQWEGCKNGSLTSVSAPPWSEAAAIRMQIPHIWWTGSLLPTLVPISCMQTAQEHTQSCHLSWSRWGLGSCYYVKSWNWLKLITIYPPSFPLRVASLH